MRRPALLPLLLACCALLGSAAAATWTSPATGTALPLARLEPVGAPAAAPPPAVVYLLNLAAPRAGTEPDDTIIADLRARGHVVLTLDYGHHPRARWPWINADFVALRRQLQQGSFPGGGPLDLAHVFLVPSGHRLQRDLVYAREDGRAFALDLVYPAQASAPTGVLLEFSCDNAARLGNASLDFCTDTILAGAATAGFAVAMADHPVPAPYHGFDPLPECGRRVHAAVRAVRAAGAPLGLNGRVVALGFSRGSGMALLLATSAGQPDFTAGGLHPEFPSAVDGAVVMSGRFSYLDLRPDDPMLPRYIQAWGDRATHAETWRCQGALDQLAGPTVPLFLTINVSESPDARHQMDVLRARLTARGSPFSYHPETEPRGHRMPLAPAVLDPLLVYLRARLSGPAAAAIPRPSP